MDSLLNQAYGHQGSGVVPRRCTPQRVLSLGRPVHDLQLCMGLDPPWGHMYIGGAGMRITIFGELGAPGTPGAPWQPGDPYYVHCCVPGNMMHFSIATVVTVPRAIRPVCRTSRASAQPSQALPAGHSYDLMSSRTLPKIGNNRRLQCNWDVVD